MGSTSRIVQPAASIADRTASPPPSPPPLVSATAPAARMPAPTTAAAIRSHLRSGPPESVRPAGRPPRFFGACTVCAGRGVFRFFATLTAYPAVRSARPTCVGSYGATLRAARRPLHLPQRREEEPEL